MSPSAAARFYLSYLLAKTILLWREVNRPRGQLFLYEMLYSIGRLRRAPLPDLPRIFRATEVSTVYGHFHIRPNTADMLCVSPAFERTDLRHMIRTAARLGGPGRRLLFLDVGADFGTYTVAIGNSLKRQHVDFRIAAFEPTAASAALLRRNVDANGLDGHVSVHEVALWNEDDQHLSFEYSTRSPGSSGSGPDPGRADVVKQTVTTRRLDSILGSTAEFDAVLMKIDVEGAERQVLEGADDLLLRADTTLLVEDFVDASIIAWLQDRGWTLQGKLTPYNSWWQRPARSLEADARHMSLSSGQGPHRGG